MDFKVDFKRISDGLKLCFKRAEKPTLSKNTCNLKFNA